MNSQDFSGAVPRAVLRRSEVCTMVGIKPASLHRWIKAGQFPRPIMLGPRRVGWRVEDVQEWLDNRPPTQSKVV